KTCQVSWHTFQDVSGNLLDLGLLSLGVYVIRKSRQAAKGTTLKNEPYSRSCDTRKEVRRDEFRRAAAEHPQSAGNDSGATCRSHRNHTASGFLLRNGS